MAKRRMFSMDIIDTDVFLEMPMSTQLLYFHLAMRADDDGFIASVKKVMRITGAKKDDLEVLISRQFVIPFETGVCVIKHWKIHNYIQKDRYHETIYKEEKKLLADVDSVYILDTECIQNGYSGKVSLGESSQGKDSVDKKKRFTPPTPKEVKEYADSINFTTLDPDRFIDHYETNGWMRGKTKIRDWKACVRTWKKNEKPTKQQASKETYTSLPTFAKEN